MPPIDSGFSVQDRRPCFKLLLTRKAERFSGGADAVACLSLPRLEIQLTTIHWTKIASSVGADKFRTTCIWFDPLDVITPSGQASKATISCK